MSALRTSLLLCLTLCLSLPSYAQSIADVPLDDPIYRDLDRLVALGLMDTIAVGRRPYSGRMIAFAASEARSNAVSRCKGLTTCLPPSVRESLERVESRAKEFAEDGFRPIDRAAFSLVQSGSTRRFVPADDGIGGVDATIDPLALFEGSGASRPRGRSLMLVTRHVLSVGDRFAAVVAPQLGLPSDQTFSAGEVLTLRELSARVAYHNLSATVGRAPLRWGQGERGGLLVSGNARALDRLSIETTRPFVMPGFLRVAGPSTLTLFIADLGARQTFPHTKLIGYGWNGSPTPRMELGFGVLDFVGGRGAPPASTGKILTNLFLFPILPAKGYEFSNIVFATEARIRVPALSNAQLYWEMSLDDFGIHRVADALWVDDAAHIVGVSLPLLGAQGRSALTAEFHHTGARFGRHPQFTSGPTLNRVLLGDPLGPNAEAVYVSLERTSPAGSVLHARYAAEVFRSDQHVLTAGPFAVRLTEHRPSERRQRLESSITFPMSERNLLRVHGGIEYITRFEFVPGYNHTQALGAVSWSWTAP